MNGLNDDEVCDFVRLTENKVSLIEISKYSSLHVALVQ